MRERECGFLLSQAVWLLLCVTRMRYAKQADGVARTLIQSDTAVLPTLFNLSLMKRQLCLHKLYTLLGNACMIASLYSHDRNVGCPKEQTCIDTACIRQVGTRMQFKCHTTKNISQSQMKYNIIVGTTRQHILQTTHTCCLFDVLRNLWWEWLCISCVHNRQMREARQVKFTTVAHALLPLCHLVSVAIQPCNDRAVDLKGAALDVLVQRHIVGPKDWELVRVDVLHGDLHLVLIACSDMTTLLQEQETHACWSIYRPVACCKGTWLLCFTIV